MKHRDQTSVLQGLYCLPVSFLVLTFTVSSSLLASAVTSSSPYGGIVDRNVFGLKPPTPPPGPEETKAPPGNITLTGITTILGNKRALLHVSVSPRPPAQAKEENYMLTEGQRDGEVEVLEINEKVGSVKVNNAGQIATLTFDKNGAKAAAAPTTVPIPMPIPAPAMAANPQAGANPGGTSAIRTIPTRNSRLLQPQNASTESTVEGSASGQTGPLQHQIQMDPETQELMIEAQRMKYQNENNPISNLLPPTRLGKNLQGENSQNPQLPLP